MKNILLICLMFLSLKLSAQTITTSWVKDSIFTTACETAYFSTNKSVSPTKKTNLNICVYQDMITYVTVKDITTNESILEYNPNIEYRLYWDKPYNEHYWSRSEKYPSTVEKNNNYLFFIGPDSIESVNVIILQRTFIKEDSTDCLFLFVGGIAKETSPIGSNMFHTIDMKKTGVSLKELEITNNDELEAYIINEQTSVKYKSTSLEIKNDGNIDVTFDRKAFESSHRIHLTDHTGLYMSYLIN